MSELLYAGSGVQELSDADISLRQGGGGSAEFYCTRPQFADSPQYIIFYAPWCGHCHNVAPTMKELAKTMLVGAVNSNVASDATQRVGISGFPTIFFLKNASASPVKYEGDRSLEAFQSFKEQAVPKSTTMPVPNSPEWNAILRRALLTAVHSVKNQITNPPTSPSSYRLHKRKGGSLRKRSKTRKDRKVSKNSRRRR
jgi:thiol-disulfide isomerase/thioredoxin